MAVEAAPEEKKAKKVEAPKVDKAEKKAKAEAKKGREKAAKEAKAAKAVAKKAAKKTGGVTKKKKAAPKKKKSSSNSSLPAIDTGALEAPVSFSGGAALSCPQLPNTGVGHGSRKEFKQFAMKGNVIDMAVGIIIGAGFGKIVASLVDGVLMPPIG